MGGESIGLISLDLRSFQSLLRHWVCVATQMVQTLLVKTLNTGATGGRRSSLTPKVVDRSVGPASPSYVRENQDTLTIMRCTSWLVAETKTQAILPTIERRRPKPGKRAGNHREAGPVPTRTARLKPDAKAANTAVAVAVEKNPDLLG